MNSNRAEQTLEEEGERPIRSLGNDPLRRMAEHWLRQIAEWVQSLEGRVAIVLALIIWVFSRNFGIFDVQAPYYQHLGAEYYNIALALADGRGYSDPFGEMSGPTAWMPPLYPLLLAGILKLVHQKALVADVIVFLGNLALVAVGVLLFRIAKRCRAFLPPLTIVGLYVLWLWAFYGWFFMMTHDIWLLALVVASILYAIVNYVEKSELNPWTWGLLGGIAALTSPSVAFAWLGVSAWICLRHAAQRRRALSAMAMAACLAAPWIIRNAVVFEKLIPSKSNLYYEAHSANYEHDRGVYDGSFDEHPYMSPITRFEYAKLGESGFIEKHRAKFFEALAEDPGRYLRNVGHRALAVTVKYIAHKDEYIPYAKRLIQRIVYALPFIGLLIALLVRSASLAFVRPLTFFLAIYVTPYILIAFYARYQMMLTSVLVLFTFIGADQAAHAFAKRRALMRGDAASKAG